jgi:TPR repeat protein
MNTVLFFVLVAAQTATLPAQTSALEEGRAAISAGDYPKALRLLQPLANEGNAVAQNAIGFLYLNGWGVKQDFKDALQWFHKAAEQEDSRAQFNLGWMYYQGHGVPQDHAETARWYRKSADQGHPQAQTMLAALYAIGDGVPQDYAEAMKWYRRAAEQGNAVAQSSVGFMYVEGQGVPKDYAEAEKWFRQAAAQKLPISQYWLGRLYFEGWGVKRDFREAVRWLEMPDTRDLPDAQYTLGLIYANGGDDVKKDDAVATQWLRRAAGQGHPGAAKLLGEQSKSDAPQEPKPKVKTGEIKAGKQYQSSTGMFTITVPPGNWAMNTYKLKQSQLKQDNFDYEEVVFYISDFGQAYASGVRRIPQAALAQMAKEEEKQTLSNLANKALFLWRGGYAEEPQPVEETSLQTQFGAGLLRIYLARRSSMIERVVGGKGADRKGEPIDTHIAVLVVKKGDWFIYAAAEDDDLQIQPISPSQSPSDPKPVLRKALQDFFASMAVKI